MRQMMLPLFLFLLVLGTGCEEELTDNTGLLPGYWAQEAILEDGEEISMTDCESSTRLLIEQNGIYRLFSSCDTIDRSGTWLITNDTILDLSMDRWNGSNSYEPYPIRFTMLNLTDQELEIRIKTVIGERKKMVLFTPVAQDSLELLTDEEILALDRYNKTLKTWVYRFTKQD
jgi:hypothetical protein